jgi:hypothetical protein
LIARRALKKLGLDENFTGVEEADGEYKLTGQLRWMEMSVVRSSASWTLVSTVLLLVQGLRCDEGRPMVAS